MKNSTLRIKTFQGCPYKDTGKIDEEINLFLEEDNVEYVGLSIATTVGSDNNAGQDALREVFSDRFIYVLTYKQKIKKGHIKWQHMK